MRIQDFFKAAALTLPALFYSILELLYQAGRFVVKWFLVGIILAIAALVFLVMLPYSFYKCAARVIAHRSFSAGGQLMKWICKDYWKAAGL